MMSTEVKDIEFAIIGGTGLYSMDELSDVEQIEYDTRFGSPSAPVTIGRLQGRKIVFLPRHGGNAAIAPHRVNYRANIAALKSVGVKKIIAVNAVGGITLGPQKIAVCDQVIDYTHGRLSSFSDFEGEKVNHIDFTDPYTESLRQALLQSAARLKIEVSPKAVYACTQGPRLETRAEVAKLARDGNDVIGMTGMPEAVLAREAELEYASLAVIANWAAGCGDSAEITLQEIYDNLAVAMKQVRAILLGLSF
jgi:5'-methylthioinosine phosphorylase